MLPDPLDRFSRRSLFGQSAGDAFLSNVQSARLELLRYIGDDDRPKVSCQFRLVGCVDVAPDVPTGELLLKLVQALGAERQEGGDA
jgi:hypothetical protein